jgi:hypothetical protein
VFRTVAATRHGAQNTGVVNDAAGHMHTVETGKYKKSSREETFRRRL